uniref:NADH dehydrogenase subunit 2 n=1 Tax=Plesionika edwardsii TaxID=1073554 RepID=UPI002237AC23|nr:NADH dehydrogenase subunit 2 [Plesionika edwardsii]UYG50027.1 NADH dehydrogenase subunit 2 [Plesionika edwardsii]
MFTLNPARLLFFSSLILGTLVALSSTSWFTAWLGLELNLLSFIPLISSKSNLYSSEAALKYFLIQALGSAIILASAPALLAFTLSPSVMISSALLLKMGAAPVHFWFPSVMQGIGWVQCLILMTNQKVAPMLMLTYLYNDSITHIIFISSILSSLVGSLGGLNQTLMRKIMAYSSINHMAWMLAAIHISVPLWTNYFLTYTLVSSTVVAIMNSQQIYHFNQTSNLFHRSTMLKISSLFCILSLGGLPPFLGFLPKLSVIQSLAFSNSILWLSVLLLSALITLFYYLRMILLPLTLSSPKNKGALSSPRGSLLTAITFINLTPLMTPLVTFLPF